MFNIAVIVFREFLEVALVLGILLAATRGLQGRGRWIGLGLGAGLLGACLVALFTEAIANFAEGIGQELFNAAILLLAAAMIGWTVVWMRIHGRKMAADLKRIGQSVSSGELPMVSLSVAIALSTLREGSEAVLFSYGQMAAGATAADLIAGWLSGAIGGVLAGALLYMGLLNMATRHLFSVTTALLTLLAAGMAAQAAGFLVQAGLVPDLVPEVWDSSHFLAQDSILGQLLHVLVGYIAQPSGIQLFFYAAALLLIAVSLRFFSRPLSSQSGTVRA